MPSTYYSLVAPHTHSHGRIEQPHVGEVGHEVPDRLWSGTQHQHFRLVRLAAGREDNVQTEQHRSGGG